MRPQRPLKPLFDTFVLPSSGDQLRYVETYDTRAQLGGADHGH